MAFSVSPLVGIDLTSTVATQTNSAGTAVPTFGPLGTQVWGSDGRRYVLAQANASIAASDTDCTVNASTFLATASGGAYLSPATALVSGDVAWFSGTSV